MKPVGVLLRLDPAVLANIDSARGRQERTAWIRSAIDAYLPKQEAKAAEPLFDPTAMDAFAGARTSLEGVPISALPPAGGVDPLVSEIVGDAPKHYHKRELVSTEWINGQKVSTYRCSICGTPLA